MDDDLADLGLTSFGDPSPSPLDPSSLLPTSSGSAQNSPQSHNSGGSHTVAPSPSQDQYTESALPPLDLFDAAYEAQSINPSGAASNRNSPPATSEYRWFEPPPQPRRSPGFNPASHGVFPLTPVESSTSRLSLLDLSASGPFTPRSTRTQGYPSEPVAGPSRELPAEPIATIYDVYHPRCRMGCDGRTAYRKYPTSESAPCQLTIWCRQPALFAWRTCDVGCHL